MKTAQVTTTAAVPAKAAASTAAPRAADPRGNNRTGQGKVTVTPTTPRVSGSTKTAAAIGRAAGAVGGFFADTPGVIADDARAVNSAVQAFNNYKIPIGPTSNPNAPIPAKQRERANTAKTVADKATRDAQVTSPTQGYASVPGQAPQPGRPAPGRAPASAFKGGVTGSGTATAPKTPDWRNTAGAFKGGVTGSGTATAPKAPAGVQLPNGGKANTQTPSTPSGKPQDNGKPADPAKPQTSAGAASGAGSGAGSGAAPAASGAAPATPGSGGSKGPLPSVTPFNDRTKPRNVGGVEVVMPNRVDLGKIDQKALGGDISSKITQAGGLGKIKEGTVLTSFKGAAGVPFNVVVRGGKVVAVDARTPAAANTSTTGPDRINPPGVEGGVSVGDTATPASTTALEAAAATTTPATPPPSGSSAAEFVQDQLNNNPELGMGAANNSAAAALKALYAKTGMGLADENGQVIDPNTLLGGDPNKVIDWSKYTLKLAPMGDVSGATVTGKNYLDFQVNPNEAGGDTNLVGTALGNMILKQKQARADLLEQQRAGGTTGGGQGQSQSERATTSNALGYTDLVRGTLGGGIADVQQTRSNALKDALDKMLTNPEAFGYVAPPAATAPSTGSTEPPKATAPPAGGSKVFKIGETKKWGGKTHRWNGAKWITVKPKVK